MNLRWLWFDYVDPELPLGRAERRGIRRRVRQMRRGVRTGFNRWDLAEQLMPMLAVAALIIIWHYLIGLQNMSFLTFIIIYSVYVWLIFAAVMRYTRRPWVLRAIRERGFDICLHCGYWLRGLRDDAKQCPECGTGREPMVTIVNATDGKR